MKALRQIATLIRKDLGLQFRSKETLALIFVFSILVVLIFAFAFGPNFPPEKSERAKLTASVLWAAFVFAGIITLNRSFVIERTHEAIHGIRLTGVDPSFVYISKVISNLIFLLLLEIVITPIALQFYNLFDEITVIILLKITWYLGYRNTRFLCCRSAFICYVYKHRWWGKSFICYPPAACYTYNYGRHKNAQSLFW